MKRRLSRDLANTSKGSRGLYTGGEFSMARKYKIMHSPPCRTPKSKLVPAAAIKREGTVLGLEDPARWEAWLSAPLSWHNSTAGQLSAQSRGCSRISCWHFHEKFRNFLGGCARNSRRLSPYWAPSSSANQTCSFPSSSWPQLSHLARGTASLSGRGKCLSSDGRDEGSSGSIAFLTAIERFWKCCQRPFIRTLHGVEHNRFRTLLAYPGFVNAYFWSWHDDLSRVRLETGQNLRFCPFSLHYSLSNSIYDYWALADPRAGNSG